MRAMEAMAGLIDNHELYASAFNGNKTSASHSFSTQPPRMDRLASGSPFAEGEGEHVFVQVVYCTTIGVVGVRSARSEYVIELGVLPKST